MRQVDAPLEPARHAEGGLRKALQFGEGVVRGEDEGEDSVHVRACSHIAARIAGRNDANECLRFGVCVHVDALPFAGLLVLLAHFVSTSLDIIS